MSRFGAFPRLCPPAGGRLGRHAVWGKEGILPPASVSSSQWFTRVFSALERLVVCVCSCLRCLCLRSPPSHNPLPRFQNSVRGVAFATKLLHCKRTAALIQGRGRPSGNARRCEAVCACPSHPVRAHPAREVQKGSRAGLPLQI